MTLLSNFFTQPASRSPISPHFYFASKHEKQNYCYNQSNNMDESYNNKTQENLAFEIEQLQYSRKLGTFKPKFAGIPQDYIPLTWTEGFLYASMVLLTIGSVLGIMIGFMFWIIRHGLADFAAIWSAIFLVFVVIMIFAFFFGGKNRIRQEKKLIALAQKKQEEMKGEKSMKRS